MKIHPIANLGADDFIGEISVQRSSVNMLGEEIGRFWESNGLLVGWDGAEFEELRNLARKFEDAPPIRGRASHEFLLDEIFQWLRETLEAKREDALPDYVAERCASEVKDYEIWIPIYRTYSGSDFMIGEVEFRTISKAMLDEWFAKLSPPGVHDAQIANMINRDRADIQGSIAACVKVRAELKKAREIAQSSADEAIGLLRFLSPVNWTCKVVSHCLPVGRENTQKTIEILVEDGRIRSTNRASIEQGPAAWNLDESRQASPGLLEALHKLARGRDDTDFTRTLYGALQLHSRHSVAVEIPHKVVFVIAAVESFLLKDSNEPIQKNLGERMAFLIADKLEERKGVIRNVEDFYAIRSALVHHGRRVRVEDIEVIDKFFFNVWYCFTFLLVNSDQYKTKTQLLAMLEDRKLT
jgi:hypothetical protein